MFPDPADRIAGAVYQQDGKANYWKNAYLGKYLYPDGIPVEYALKSFVMPQIQLGS